ncbi:transcriptional regulator, Fur family [Aliarcobacter faecis]|uniref:Fur family transcriptional regulator n=1 Tax=Aliarcobacter faecis TaxID=1564138 RepID=UPI00047B2FA6|nr:transcriptional repressor [Aliarcobacter faecis]QKF73907.1 transcriptional regulator, Fur family [Aliarcobacter faecis]
MDNLKQTNNFSNIKLTVARKSILDILVNSKKPLCYEDIKDKISMDKATFYRNIAIFEEENIVNSFESNDKKRYFEIKDKEHIHFICSNCSAIECIYENPNFSLNDYKIDNIILKGKCKECNKNE